MPPRGSGRDSAPRHTSRPQPFTPDEEAQIVAGIRAAEHGNRGEVRVHVEESCPGGDALTRCRAVYEALGMRATRDDTGVLVYVAPKDRKVAVFAGSGIFGATTSGFWQEVVEAVADGYRSGDGVGGLVRGLVQIGDLLRTHAPGGDSAGNELPDAVTTS